MVSIVKVQDGNFETSDRNDLEGDWMISAPQLFAKIAFKITSGSKGCVGVNVKVEQVKELLESLLKDGEKVSIIVTGGDDSSQSIEYRDSLSELLDKLHASYPTLEVTNNSLEDVHDNSVALLANELKH